MLTLPETTALRLHATPRGHRLDFTIPEGRYAYVYRRTENEPWCCVARNACSPYVDSRPLYQETKPEYVVCFCDGSGIIMAATPIVQAR
ncbi:hypothetical protein [Hymenobacter fodinae]|uniref:Uncharacterized protein n=1 Tax=Hymenobacter fodinae TaxID=2510796 RepID=A0A4Z0P6Q0_9BACT|nr:hypothetical protein [Hymenobacter fodinae]TGE06347.1 hypothetical protein EU556_15985 [Hymenobacter fodinae]